MHPDCLLSGSGCKQEAAACLFRHALLAGCSCYCAAAVTALTLYTCIDEHPTVAIMITLPVPLVLVQ